MKKALLVAIVVLSVLGAMAIPAWASRPEVIPWYDAGTDVLADCGDFYLMDDYVIEGQYVVFSDSEGDPVRAQFHLKVLTHSTTPKPVRSSSAGAMAWSPSKIWRMVK